MLLCIPYKFTNYTTPYYSNTHNIYIYMHIIYNIYKDSK